MSKFRYTQQVKQAGADICKNETPMAQVNGGNARYRAFKYYDFGDKVVYFWQLSQAPYLVFMNEGTRLYKGHWIGFTRRAFAGVVALANACNGQSTTTQNNTAKYFTSNEFASSKYITKMSTGDVLQYTTKNQQIARMNKVEKDAKRYMNNGENPSIRNQNYRELTNLLRITRNLDNATRMREIGRFTRYENQGKYYNDEELL